MAVGFLFSFLVALTKGDAAVDNELCANSMPKPMLLSSAKHVVGFNRDYYPVGEPMLKFGATIQASGSFHPVGVFLSVPRQFD